MVTDSCDMPLPLLLLLSKDGTEATKGLSVTKTQSPEWQGPLPIGRAVDNYTVNIIGTWDEGRVE